MEQSVMANKFFILITILLISCGKDVSISTKELQYNSTLSNGTSISSNQEGLLLRDTKDRLVVGGTTYNVSIYSSYLALEFIAARPLNSQHQVKFKGKLRGSEIILELIETK